MTRCYTVDVALLLAALIINTCGAFLFEKNWLSSRERLSDYEAVRTVKADSEIHCTTTVSANTTVQLVTFSELSGLCTHYRCRLGLSHCRKCRNVKQQSQKVWTTASDCWTTVQHRVSGSVDFYRNWSQYQSEFGEGPDGNYWIGLNNLHKLTSVSSRRVRFLMKTWNGSESWAEYSSFSVGPESDKYRLSASGFSGSAGIGDCLSYGHGMQFSTKDADHDTASENCANTYFGAWWFSSCHCTHPNGQYKNFSIAIGGPYAQGVIWSMDFGHFYSLMEFEMLVR